MADKVIVTKTKLDALATSISEKSGVATPMTIAQMKAAVDGITAANITQDENGYLVLDNGESSSGQMMYSIDEIFGNGIDGNIVYSGTSLDYPLAYRTNITSFTADSVTSMPLQATTPMFCNCTNLSNISMKSMTRLYNCGRIFENCTSLTSITSANFPNVAVWYGTRSLAGCTNLELFCVPKLGTSAPKYLNSSHFDGCTKLETIDMAYLERIIGSTFANSSVSKIIMRSGIVLTLDNINAFNNTPFASDGTGGIFYVPSSLISSYQSATNWSTILGYENNQILSIEGSIYETKYADGTAIT